MRKVRTEIGTKIYDQKECHLCVWQDIEGLPAESDLHGRVIIGDRVRLENQAPKKAMEISDVTEAVEDKVKIQSY